MDFGQALRMMQNGSTFTKSDQAESLYFVSDKGNLVVQEKNGGPLRLFNPSQQDMSDYDWELTR